MKISIFGMGYVGIVSGACFAEMGHSVVGVDVNRTKISLLNGGISPIVEEGIDELVKSMVDQGRLVGTNDVDDAVLSTDVSIISVGTPSRSNGSLDLTAVHKVTEQIATALKKKDSYHVIIYRSTVLPGTVEGSAVPIIRKIVGHGPGENYDVAFNPEFLREGSSIRDFKSPPMTVVGSSSDNARAVMADLYAGLDAPYKETTIKIAESVKYLSNVYHALKITFANEAGSVLSRMGVDSRDAMELFCEDHSLNISRAYLRPGFAFGGSCLPKDLRAFSNMAKSMDVETPMLDNIMPSNNAHIERALDMVRSGSGRRVLLFGLAFKAGTDDMRESPIVRLAEDLIGKGYELSIYDSHVNAARLIGANLEFIRNEIPHFERLLVEDPGDVIEAVDSIVIANIDAANEALVIERGQQAMVVDLCGVRSLQHAVANYQGLCW